MALFTPTNQKRLTNVSVVRLRKGGNRFELACYPNKVRAWRDRLETNLDEVLQIECVFTNVSKGQFANKKDLYQAFGMENETKIIQLILEQGELQLTEKERAVEKQHIFRDVAKMVSERCVNPETNRAYTVTMIEKMMKDCHVSLKANKNAKQNALEVIKQLRSIEGFKIASAMMEVVISIEQTAFPLVKDHVLQLCTNVLRQSQSDKGNVDLSVVVEPENYGAIESLLHSHIKGKYCIEIVGNTKHDVKRVTNIKADNQPSQSGPNSDRTEISAVDDNPSSAENTINALANAHFLPPKPSTNHSVDKSSKKPSKSRRKKQLASSVVGESVDGEVVQSETTDVINQKPVKNQRKKKGKKGKSRDDDW